MFIKRISTALCAGAMVCGVATVAVAGTGAAGRDHTHTPGPSVSIGPVGVGGNVSVVMGIDGFAGGNVGVSAGPDGLLIIDDLLPGFQHKLENVLAQLKTCSDCGDLKYLINTHWHFDHVGNNEFFGGPAVLIAHETVGPLLANPQEFKSMGMRFEPKVRAGLPDVTFAMKASVHFNGEEIELTHFPSSHTTGDIVAYFTKSNVLHTGDLFFNGMFPFIDVEHGGKIKGMIRSVERILKHYPQDVKIIPGHGALSNQEDLRKYLQMLKETTRAVEAAKASGKSLEEAQKAGLDDKWKSWAWPFVSTDAWIAMIYGSL